MFVVCALLACPDVETGTRGWHSETRWVRRRTTQADKSMYIMRRRSWSFCRSSPSLSRRPAFRRRGQNRTGSLPGLRRRRGRTPSRRGGSRRHALRIGPAGSPTIIIDNGSVSPRFDSGNAPLPCTLVPSRPAARSGQPQKRQRFGEVTMGNE